MTTGRVLDWPRKYDLLEWLFTHGRPRAFRDRLIRLARLDANESVLDVGCGTGSLAILSKRTVGDGGRVVGIDASAAMVARAQIKARRNGVEAEFRQAAVEALPFADGSFDAVLSTLMLHHLPRKVRQQGMAEIRRVLTPSGRFFVVDFGSRADHVGFLAHFHRHGHVDPREIGSLLEGAGFRAVDEGPVGLSSLQYVLARRVEQ
jgi:ubiquinone/menaquinone biosynthesis C-methylase UbiE